jgi:hypothetical protein
MDEELYLQPVAEEQPVEEPKPAKTCDVGAITSICKGKGAYKFYTEEKQVREHLLSLGYTATTEAECDISIFGTGDALQKRKMLLLAEKKVVKGFSQAFAHKGFFIYYKD